jgi:hypothetical protein
MLRFSSSPIGATLPGIVRAALAMPDIHQGYGFPSGAWWRPTPRRAWYPRARSASTSTVVYDCCGTGLDAARHGTADG